LALSAGWGNTLLKAPLLTHPSNQVFSGKKDGRPELQLGCDFGVVRKARGRTATPVRPGVVLGALTPVPRAEIFA
jgi:hypothetical protein